MCVEYRKCAGTIGIAAFGANFIGADPGEVVAKVMWVIWAGRSAADDLLVKMMTRALR